MKKRYVQVGIGGRSYMYSDAIKHKYPEYCQLAGLCDTNRHRMDIRNKRFTEGDAHFPEYKPVSPVKTYTADQFDLMLEEQKPDTVIVTCMDSAHDGYIIRAMNAGCDVICEKPLTIDSQRCQKIIDTVGRTGRNLKVTFNCRYSPVRALVKQTLMDGAVGDILSVDFFWNLNTSHGADYFRRWHRQKENSGGLLVHKATHHFDLVNWWIAAVPEEVYCIAGRQFYTPAQAERYGLKNRGKRCRNCPESKKCKFYLDIEANPDLKSLYLDAEKYDGYQRDLCVFDEEIGIEDSMNATVRYDTGVMMSYALNAFTPWEGYSISFNGTLGRLEHTCVERVYINGDGSTPGELIKKGTSVTVHPHFAEPYALPIPEARGGHGGGDDPLLADIFNPNAPKDPLKRAAGLGDGAWSILTGIAANQSIRTGLPVRPADLVHGIPEPSFRKD
ncbi:MAG: Gfo/Idh/MocA family oxidoreductase [Armatimonadota bacterium]